MLQFFTFINFYLLRYLLVFYFASIATPSTAQFKIMTLGNSITQGSIYNDTTEERPSYRYQLWRLLVEAGVDFEFVGSHDVNHEGTPAVKGTVLNGKTYTNRNEGHWGWSADEVLNNRNLDIWLQGYTPDIVLIHLGTNDMFRQCGSAEAPNTACYQNTIVELKEVIRQIRGKNASTAFFVAKLIPAYEPKVGSHAANNIKILNDMIPALVRDMNTVVSPVTLVDQYTDFDATIGADTYDGIHPNASGELKMAQKWFAAIEPAITPQPVELTSFEAAATASGHILLTWQTASEEDNAYFEVQRAANATEFNPVGQVKGAGTTYTAQLYSFEDSTATAGDVYYRLQQVDTDGSSSYSKIIHVEKEQKAEKLQVYPTNSSGGQHVTVHLQHHQPETAVDIKIFSSTGKLVKQFSGQVSSGGSLVQDVAVHDLHGAGLYFVHVSSAGQQLQGEFILKE